MSTFCRSVFAVLRKWSLALSLNSSPFLFHAHLSKLLEATFEELEIYNLQINSKYIGRTENKKIVTYCWLSTYYVTYMIVKIRLHSENANCLRNYLKSRIEEKITCVKKVCTAANMIYC